MDGINEQEANINRVHRSRLLEKNAMILKKRNELKMKNGGGGRGRPRMNPEDRKPKL